MATKANINRNCGTGNDVKNATAREFYKDICGKCGAQRIDSQIGMEETPEQFVANMVEVFREVWRVLRDDGTLWLNLGDSYSGSGKGPAGNLGATKHNERWLEHQSIRQIVMKRTQTERPSRHTVAGRVRTPSRRLVPATRHHLAQTKPDARISNRPMHQIARIHIPAQQISTVLL
jgi:hypothetical protein